jgi:hypothetical protein
MIVSLAAHVQQIVPLRLSLKAMANTLSMQILALIAVLVQILAP